MNKFMGYISIWTSGFVFPVFLISHNFEFRILGLIFSVISLYSAYNVFGGKSREEINKKEFNSN